MPCFASLHVCRTRITRLDSTGAPVIGSTTTYVSDTQVTVGITPENVAGQDLEVISGCGCPTLTYRGRDRTKRFTFDIEQSKIEPPMLEMMTEATLIAGATPGSFIGTIARDDTTSCEGLPNGVAIEFWTDAWDGNQPLSATPYRRLLFTRTIWTEGETALSADFQPVKLTGFSLANSNYGDPYADLPATLDPDDISQYAQWVEADAPPSAACAYAALSGS